MAKETLEKDLKKTIAGSLTEVYYQGMVDAINFYSRGLSEKEKGDMVIKIVKDTYPEIKITSDDELIVSKTTP